MYPPAAEQCGVFTRAEALAAGLSPKQIRRLVRTGAWQRVLGAAFVRQPASIGLRTRCWAAVLDAGPTAVVTGPAALHLHGIATSDERVHVTSTRLRPRRPEVVVHQERLAPAELLVDEDGLVLTQRRRSVLDALRFLPLAEAQRVLDEALRRRWVDADWLIAQAHRCAGRRGAPQLARLAAGNAGGALYPAERLLHDLLRQAGVTRWDANVPLHDAAGLVGYGDVVFRDAPLVLEVDGRTYHSTADRFQADRTRQNRLVNAGYTVLRFTWDDVTRRPEHVIAQVRAALGRLPRPARAS